VTTSSKIPKVSDLVPWGSVPFTRLSPDTNLKTSQKHSPENLLENTETLVDVVFEQFYENAQKFGIRIMSDN